MAKLHKNRILHRKYTRSTDDDEFEPDFYDPRYQKEMKQIKKAVAGKSSSELDAATNKKLNDYYTKEYHAKRRNLSPETAEQYRQSTSELRRMKRGQRIALTGDVSRKGIGQSAWNAVKFFPGMGKNVIKAPATGTSQTAKKATGLFLFGAQAAKTATGAFGTNTSYEKGIENAKRKYGKEKYISASGKQQKAKYEPYIPESERTGKETMQGTLGRLGSKINPVFKKYTGYENPKAFAGKQKQRAEYMQKHPFKGGAKGAGMLAGTQIAAAKKLSGISGKAMSNLSNAAQRIVESNRLLAIFKPIFWYIKIAQIGLSRPMPFFYAGLIIGIGLMIWLFGWVSGYYALYFLKCLPAVVANVILTVLNAIWFGIHGIYNTFVAGITTVINQIAYFFLGGLLEFLKNSILHFGGGFVGLPVNAQIQPGSAFAYVVPNPIDVSTPAATIGSFFLGWTWIQPGSQPYLYNYATDSPMFDIQFAQNGAELKFPSINPAATAEGIWCTLTDRPPPWLNYTFPRDAAGEYYDSSTGNWTLKKTSEVSLSIIFGAASVVTSDPITPRGWFAQTGYYSQQGWSETRPRAEMIFRQALIDYFNSQGYTNVDGAVSRWSARNAIDWSMIPPGIDHYKAFLWADSKKKVAIQEHCWTYEYKMAENAVRVELGTLGFYSKISQQWQWEPWNVPWSVIYNQYYLYIQKNMQWWPEDGNDLQTANCILLNHG